MWLEKNAIRTFFVLCLLLLAACQGRNLESTLQMPDLPSATSISYEKEVSFLSQIIEDNPSADLYYQRAILHLGEKKENLALEDLKKALLYDSLQAKYHFALLQVYLLREEPKKALAAAERAELYGIKAFEFYRLYGKLNIEERKWNKAHQCFDHILNLIPQDLEALYYKGFAFAAQRDSTQAISYLNQAISQKKDYLDAHIALIRLYQDLRKTRLALQQAETALAIFPQNPTLHFLVGNIHQQTGKNETAQFWYRKTAELDTTSWQAHHQVGMYYFYKEYYSGALPYLERALRHNAQLYQAAYCVGFIYEYKTKREENALLYYQKAQNFYQKAQSAEKPNANITEALTRIAAKIEREVYKNSPEYAAERLKRYQQEKADRERRYRDSIQNLKRDSL
ncbi:tetratricopeptide repeat protein [Hugenholtzia roseola]|uniref:tetratricopeptide repeat protein n=1 Tax=Hugenholtzia roseola TaxID=1002 RepID=UPI0003F5A601|nr:tetratricopeptide repeat protein [Hugenholtzia roseola]